MPATPLVYRGAIALARGLLPLYARFHPKVQAGLAGRALVLDRMAEWSATRRDPFRPLLWMHASSVGEGRQAEVVLRRLRGAHPRWHVVYTYFSPSAEALAGQLDVDWTGYLAWDGPADVERMLATLRPRALVFSKLDLWPELATRAAASGTAVGIIAATVSPVSKRLRWPARTLLRAGYASVHAAGAVSADDAERLARLGVPRERIEVTGDPRHDSVVERLHGARDPVLRALTAGAPTLVAGSTWAPDEDALLAAFRAVRAARPEIRLVVVPHEPTPEHLERIDARARELELPAPVRWSRAPEPSPLVVVDRMGVLAQLYAGAAIAYVGGGFGPAGLHSVAEPAACAVPVLFGPRHQGNRDAAALLEQRGAIVVSPDFPPWLDIDAGTTHAGASPLAAIWLALLRNPGHAAAAGRRAQQCIESGLGAADRSAKLVEKLMEE
jgi:3-deoxy-D-manno-octulosonic-acid transferase